MQLKQTTDCTCRVTATYQEDGTLSAKVFASAPYNDKGATATAEFAVPADLKAELGLVMQKVLAASAAGLGEQMGDAIHAARRAARALGEDVKG